MQHIDLFTTNLVTNTICLMLSLLGMILIMMVKVIRGRYFHIILRIFIANILLVLSNYIEMLFYIKNYHILTWLLYGAILMQFVMALVLELFFIDYILYSIEEKGNNLSKIKNGLSGYFLLAIGSVFVSLYNHMYFYVDDYQRYQRGEWYWVSQVIALIGLVFICVISMKYFSQFNGRERAYLLGRLGLPIIAIVIQVYFQGLYFMTILGILLGFMLFMEIIVRQEKERRGQDNEISQMQIKVMLSQIQPHFLYNSLTTAQYLCDENPEKAAQALDHLTQFLRGNIDSLKIQSLVPFEKERFHVENYLYLEMLRFGEKLKIEWDIQCSDFMLPTLTVQPIVENAVKYGVLRKPEGGLVRISTSSDEKNCYIDVVDDGVGFDMMETKYDGRTHIGVSNVKKRLENQCGGSLEAVSVPGKGTSVRITIPKEVDT